MKRLLFLGLCFTFFGCSSEESPQPKPKPEPVQESPVAVDDNVTAVEDEETVLDSLFDNDERPGDSKLSSFQATSEQGGQIIDNRNGSFTYIPVDDFTGEDSFTYTLCNSADDCSTANVTIQVQDQGNPKANDDSVYAVENKTMVFRKLTENDDLLDEAVITNIYTDNTQGSLTLNTDGSISYTAPTGFKGTDTFTYGLCDDDTPTATCSTATVTVEVLEEFAFNIPAGLQDYYSDLGITTNADLNYEFLSDHTAVNHEVILEYFDRHDYLYEADEDPDQPDNVILMYSGESRYWEEYQSGSNSYQPQTFNTEHIYPQSLLSSEAAVTDLHHLRATDAEVNSLRSNYPYTEGSGDYDLINDSSWYPGDEWKGDVARMVLYLNIRYGENIGSVGSLEMFLKWNREDPVSAFEIQRNNVIEGAQGNRNPFIDNPYLATLLWGGEAAENRWE